MKRLTDLLHTVARAAAILVLLARASAFAWTANPPPYLVSNNIHTFRIDDDLVSQVTWRGSGPIVPPAPSPPSDPVTNTSLIRFSDRAFQYWSSMGRTYLSIRLDNNPANLSNVNCSSGPCGILNGYNEILHGPLPFWLPAGTIGATTCFSGWDCDIFIPDGNTFSLLEDSVDVEGRTLGIPTWNRNLGHELGHALGLAHPSPQTTHCATGTQSPLMCQTGTTGSSGALNGMKWDVPAHDDLDGVQGQHALFQSPADFVVGSINSAGGVSFTRESISGWSRQLITRPRIACGTATGAPQCVITATTNQCNAGFTNCVRLVGVNRSGTSWSVSTETVLNNSSKLEVDVAYARPTLSSVSVRSDSADRQWWYASWDLVNGSPVTQGQIKDQNSASISVHGFPRVAWHEGIDRYVTVAATRNRNLMIAVSQGDTGKVFNKAQFATFADNRYRHPEGGFDLACPTHFKTPGTMTAADTCTLVLHSVSSNVNNPLLAGANLGPTQAQVNNMINGQITVCQFTVSAGVPSALTCGFQQWSDTALVGVGEFRRGTPDVPGWLLGVSPNSPISAVNTSMLLATNNTFASLSALSTFNIPLGGPGRTDWGGLSCDFLEPASGSSARIIACPELNTGGTQW